MNELEQRITAVCAELVKAGWRIDTVAREAHVLTNITSPNGDRWHMNWIDSRDPLLTTKIYIELGNALSRLEQFLETKRSLTV